MDQNKNFSLKQLENFDSKIEQQHFEKKELLLLKTILSQIKGDQEEYLFNFEQLSKLGFDLENGINKEKELIKGLKKISNYFVEIQNGYGDLRLVGLIENEFLIDLETKLVSIKVNKELIPFLINLKEQYKPLQIS